MGIYLDSKWDMKRQIQSLRRYDPSTKALQEQCRENFSGLLREWRQCHNITRPEAGLLLKTDPRNIASWEGKRSLPRGPLINRIFNSIK